MLRVFSGVEHFAGVAQPTDNIRTSDSPRIVCGLSEISRRLSKRGKRHGMKWGARQEEIPALFYYRSGYELPDTASRRFIPSVRLQKWMLCARRKPGVAPVDLLCASTEAGARRAP